MLAQLRAFSIHSANSRCASRGFAGNKLEDVLCFHGAGILQGETDYMRHGEASLCPRCLLGESAEEGRVGAACHYQQVSQDEM